jgi:hypothetical protein
MNNSINNFTELYKVIVDEKLTSNQVNQILEKCLKQKTFIMNSDLKPFEIVSLLESFFFKYDSNNELPIFIE